MITVENIKNFLTEELNNSEIFLVDVLIKPGNKVFVYLDSMLSVNIDDCVRINRAINKHFDKDVEDYALEVSSAGLTSPFKTEKQYIKNLNKKVKLKTVEGQLIKGLLYDYKDNTVFVKETKKSKGVSMTTDHALPLEKVIEIKLDINF